MSKWVEVENFSPSLIRASEIAAKREGRTGCEQLEHWAWVGRAISRSSTRTMQQVEKALAGELAREELTELEAAILEAELDDESTK